MIQEINHVQQLSQMRAKLWTAWSPAILTKLASVARRPCKTVDWKNSFVENTIIKHSQDFHVFTLGVNLKTPKSSR